MVDLTALFGLGQSLAGEAITTSGTTVIFEKVTTDTDPITLEPTESAEALTGELPAIVVPAAAGGTLGQAVPGVEVRLGDWRVVLLPDTPVPAVGVEVRVVQCRDAHLVGRTAKILGSVQSSAGAVLTAYARPSAT